MTPHDCWSLFCPTVAVVPEFTIASARYTEVRHSKLKFGREEDENFVLRTRFWAGEKIVPKVIMDLESVSGLFLAR